MPAQATTGQFSLFFKEIAANADAMGTDEPVGGTP
jgi:hypothetical protein